MYVLQVKSTIVKADTGKVQAQQFYSVPHQLLIVLCPYTPTKQSIDLDLLYQHIKHGLATAVKAADLNVLVN